ncbi:hypothetical protein GW17_00052337, partial [Ensete ventricosum]
DFTNPFVEQAIQYAITASKVILVDESKKDKLQKLLLQGKAPNGVAAGEKCKPEVAKTGLGSSAAMTASVVAVLLHYLGVVSLPLSEKSLDHGIAAISDLDLVHIIEPILVQWMQLVNDQYQELVVKSLLGARNAFLEIRLHMREMGKAAGVPVSLFCSNSHYGFC